MRIVYIASVFPYPPISGHRIRNYNLLKRLAENNEVNLFLLLTELPDANELGELGAFCHTIQCFQQHSQRALDKPWLAAKYMFKGMPIEYRSLFSTDLKTALQTFFQKNDVDIVQIEDPCMAQYIEVIPPGISAKTVLTFHDVNFQKARRIARLEKHWKRKLRLWLHSRMLLHWEPKYAGKFDLCVTMSEIDAALLRERNARLNIVAIPNGVDIGRFVFSPQTKVKRNLIYVGNMDYRPNIDAVVFFCNEVLPILWQENAQYHFYIVGIHPREEVLALASSSVTVTGRVDSVVPWYAKSGVCVVPLRAGGGTRLKILESIALGCPVVSTTVGAEGLELVDGEHLLIADDAASFVERISAIYTDDTMRLRLIHAGYDQVRNLYGWDSIAEKLMKQYRNLQELNSNEK